MLRAKPAKETPKNYRDRTGETLFMDLKPWLRIMSKKKKIEVKGNEIIIVPNNVYFGLIGFFVKFGAK